MLNNKQQLSLARFAIDKMTNDQKTVLVWELVRANTWAGRLMFEIMEMNLIGPATALDVLLAVIKESQSDKYHRAM